MHKKHMASAKYNSEYTGYIISTEAVLCASSLALTPGFAPLVCTQFSKDIIQLGKQTLIAYDFINDTGLLAKTIDETTETLAFCGSFHTFGGFAYHGWAKVGLKTLAGLTHKFADEWYNIVALDQMITAVKSIPQKVPITKELFDKLEVTCLALPLNYTSILENIHGSMKKKQNGTEEERKAINTLCSNFEIAKPFSKALHSSLDASEVRSNKRRNFSEFDLPESIGMPTTTARAPQQPQKNRNEQTPATSIAPAGGPAKTSTTAQNKSFQEMVTDSSSTNKRPYRC